MARSQTHALHSLESDRRPSCRERAAAVERPALWYQLLNVSRASDYDATFRRQTGWTGWTGAEGNYSAPLRDGRTRAGQQTPDSKPWIIV